MKICAKCGWENEEGFNFCLGCGTQLRGQASSPPPAVASSGPSGPPPGQQPDPGDEDRVRSGHPPDDDWWDAELAKETSKPAAPAAQAPPAGESAPPSPLGSSVSEDPGAPRWRSTQEPRGASQAPLAAAASLAPEPAFEETRACPNCDGQIPIANKFCGRCGGRVSTDAAPAAKAAPAASPSPGRLILLLPDGSDGGTYPLRQGETVVGRTQGNIRFVDDGYISPRHATFFTRDNQVMVRDDDTVNGLFVKLRGETNLQDKDLVLLGKQLLELTILRPPKDNGDEIEIDLTDDKPPPTWGSPYGQYWGKLTQLMSGGRKGNTVLLAGENTDLGRERGDVTFPGDGFVSASHLRVAHRDGTVTAKDLGSRNGTFLRVRQEAQLRTDDILIIGEQLLRVELN